MVSIKEIELEVQITNLHFSLKTQAFCVGWNTNGDAHDQANMFWEVDSQGSNLANMWLKNTVKTINMNTKAV